MEHLHVSSNFSAPFIRRPVATSLITVAILLSGVVAFRFLPVAPLPQVDFPTISVGANLPGASPVTMASAVATPLERQFGRIAGVTQMTSSSGLGSTNITLQFDLNRDINAAARDVQAAINAARSQLPADIPSQPTYRKVNPADSPILLLALTSDNIPPAQIYDAADSILAQKLAQVEGVGQVFSWGSSRPAVRVAVNPNLINSYGISLEQVRKGLQSANANLAKGSISDPSHAWNINDTDQLFKAYEYQPLVVFVFLRNVWATIIPSVAVPLSLVGTFGVMYLFGYSLDNLSLMALTISTGFVVDDAIVVIENIARHMEGGMKPFAATMLGAKEIGFTVLSMSASLVAVFIPILMFPGIVGRLFREFAVTLSVAIGVSLFVSLTATPMLCAYFLRIDRSGHGRAYRIAESIFNGLVHLYDRSLRVVLRYQFVVLLITIGTVILTGYLYYAVPKGFFPQQDTGRINGYIQGDQDISFAAMSQKLKQFNEIVMKDPAVDTVTAFTGGGNGTSTSRMFAQLKPLNERKVSSDQVIARLRGKTSRIPGATLFMQSVQDLTIGGRFGGAQYQYTLQAENLEDLNHWAPILLQRLQKLPGIFDVNTDQQVRGLQSSLVIDRDTASRLGVNMTDIDNTLGDAFGQRQVSNIYKGLNQYHVVLEVSNNYTQGPEGLHHIYVPSNTGALIPLSSFAHYQPSNTSLSVNHQGLYPSITLSFNLGQGLALGDAVVKIQQLQ